MTDTWKDLDLQSLPGHYVRRIHQLAVALFVEEMRDINLTPVQYSSLQTICKHHGIDQKALCETIGYDSSTIGGVVDRLEARGLVVRKISPNDRRVRLLSPTNEGLAILQKVAPRILKSQERFLEPLTPKERKEFMRLMRALIDANADYSAIPTK